MADNDTVLISYENMRIAVNEVINRFTVNRNIEKLIQNDQALKNLYVEIMGGLDIQGYKIQSGISNYNIDSVVWYYHEKSNTWWILRSIKDNNLNDPRIAIEDTAKYINGHPDFQTYGWKNENEKVDILGIIDKSINSLIEKFIRTHENDKDKHKYGKIDYVNGLDQNFISKKLLKKDVSNVLDRNNMFFPFKTVHFKTNNITSGSYRLFDNGLMYIDIVFKMGTGEIDNDGYEIVKCNDIGFDISKVQQKTDKNYNENYKYFNTVDDANIFRNETTDQSFFTNEYTSTIAGTIQTNRNNVVNVYSAKLNLFPNLVIFNDYPINGFKDINYNVFFSNCMCETKDNNSSIICPSSNQLVFCDKRMGSITALLITYKDKTQDDFGSNGGIASNSFTCQLVGRWK